jgi:hypothetical protein
MVYGVLSPRAGLSDKPVQLGSAISAYLDCGSVPSARVCHSQIELPEKSGFRQVRVCGLGRQNDGGPETRRGVSEPLPMQAARKPDSVLDDHSSRRRVTAALEQPTRKFRLVDRSQPELPALAHRADTLVSAESADAIPAYLVLLRVGFTMRFCLRKTRCALTAPFHPYRRPLEGNRRRYILCCTGRLCALKHTSRTLSGTLPCGVRTFLPLRTADAAGGSDHPAACRG